MAIAPGVATKNQTASGTSIAIAAPAGLVDGDVLWAIIAQKRGSGSVIATPVGWTQIGPQVNSTTLLGVAYFYKVVAGVQGSTTFSWGATATAGAGIILATNGGGIITPYAAQAAAANASSTNIATPALVAANATYLLLEFIASATENAGITAITPPAGFVEPANGEAGVNASIGVEVSTKTATGANPPGQVATQAAAAVSIGCQIAVQNPGVTAARVSQIVTEPVIKGGTKTARVSQIVSEVAVKGGAKTARVSQVVAEVVVVAVPPAARVSQIYTEVVVQIPTESSYWGIKAG